ncbi:MAG: RNA methyltransferase [Candidatus Bathyarchaeia archaeon]
MKEDRATFLQPLKRPQKVFVAIPASIVSDTPHLREKTFKVGLIGRASAIFRVDEIIIYPDILGVDQSKDSNFVATILSYMETPQYLRKRLFGITPNLRYAGILPPLRTPHHPTKSRIKDIRVGEFRDGVVIAESKNGVLVDIGVEKPITIPDARIPIGKRVTVKISSIDDELRAILASRDEVPLYWGYHVRVSRVPLGKMIKNGLFDLVIATSRRGEPFIRIKDAIMERWKKARAVLIAFGSPTQGLQEIVRQEGMELSELADFIVNTIPNQATETVRTEEALYATLAILNILTE